MRTLTLAAAIAALVSTRVMAADRRPHHPAPAPPDSTTATVQNDLNQPVVVYLDTGDKEIRLGTVAAESDSTFTLPRWLIITDSRDVDFMVHPAKKGFDQETGTVGLRRGEHLGIEVRHD